MVELKPITEENFLDAFHLKLAPGQEDFVSHPIRSLAQAYVYRNQCQPFGICADGKMVGYVMVIYDYDIPEYDIWHMMIDESAQGRGYGGEALDRVIAYIRTKPFGNSDRIALTCNKSNPAARKLYESRGFRATGTEDEDEIELAMTAKDFSLDFISLNAHSSVRLEAEDGLVLRVDPFRIDGELHDADVVLFTHSHFDHFSPEDAERVRKPETVFVAPASMSGELKRAGLAGQAVLMRPGEETAVCGVPVLAVPSYNTNKPNHPKENGWLGYVLTVRGLRVYIAGDTDDTEDARAVACDAALLPAGGTYTMDAREAAACANAMRPAVAVPTHYGCIVGSAADGETFRKLADPEIRVELKL